MLLLLLPPIPMRLRTWRPTIRPRRDIECRPGASRTASEVGILAEPGKKQSFWTTLPGVLTGIAALLTAVTGFLVVVYPHGFAGGKESPPAVVGSATETARAAPAVGGVLILLLR